MKIAAATLLLVFTIPTALAGDDAPPQLCFDFHQAVREPMKAPPAFGKPVKDVSSSGRVKNSKAVWGAARGMVPHSIGAIYAKLLDHYTIKDSKRVKLQTFDQETPGYKDFHLVMVEHKPMPMITVNWEENWAYAVTAGTNENPKRVVISYQKTVGTKYIPRLCGSITLVATDPGNTDVALYEELEAMGARDPAETAKGHLGTLATLRR